MARLVLPLLLFAALALAASAAVSLVRALSRPASPRRLQRPSENPMPRAVRMVSFALLLTLLLGVAGGWLTPS